VPFATSISAQDAHSFSSIITSMENASQAAKQLFTNIDRFQSDLFLQIIYLC